LPACAHSHASSAKILTIESALGEYLLKASARTDNKHWHCQRPPPASTLSLTPKPAGEEEEVPASAASKDKQGTCSKTQRTYAGDVRKHKAKRLQHTTCIYWGLHHILSEIHLGAVHSSRLPRHTNRSVSTLISTSWRNSSTTDVQAGAEDFLDLCRNQGPCQRSSSLGQIDAGDWSL
jgi:hypothetical protein